MLTRRNEYVLKDSVGYLPTIDSPDTQMNTLYEVLRKANTIKDNRNIRSTIIVLDEAIYPKAIKIIWKRQETFQNIVCDLVAQAYETLSSNLMK